MNQAIYDRVLDICSESENTISYLEKLASESKEAFFPGVTASIKKINGLAGEVKRELELHRKMLMWPEEVE